MRRARMGMRIRVDGILIGRIAVGERLARLRSNKKTAEGPMLEDVDAGKDATPPNALVASDGEELSGVARGQPRH